MQAEVTGARRHIRLLVLSVCCCTALVGERNGAVDGSVKVLWVFKPNPVCL